MLILICMIIPIAILLLILYKANLLKNFQTWTLIIAIIGACGGIPKIYSHFFQQSDIKGKIISRYINLNKDGPDTMFVFKLSLYVINKPFNTEQIKCEIEFENGNRFSEIAQNARLIIFSNPMPLVNYSSGTVDYIEKRQELLVNGSEYFNNYTYFPANQNITGYLFFKFKGNLDHKIKSTIFIFESSDGNTKRIIFQESKIKAEALLHDDTIWRNIPKYKS